MKLEIAMANEPVLRQVTKKVQKFDLRLRRFVDDLVDTLLAYDGWGLAAPQVFCSERIFVMCVREEEDLDFEEYLRIFINPEIIAVSAETSVEEEACLSIPDLAVPISRPLRVKARGQDMRGRFFTQSFEGMEARCFLHEFDHLNGVLITDYLPQVMHFS